MKQIFKKIVVWILEREARIVLRKYRPKIIAVTGSVGKTSTKDAIFTVLSKSFFVRKSAKSFNSDIGVPLTILGMPNAWNNPFLWIKNIVEGFLLVIFPTHYPKWLILEVGADRPGDIKKICTWLKPDISVITRFSRVPVHVEFFKSREELIKEKGYLVKALKDNGVLILNADDEDVMQYKSLTSAHIITYGLGSANITASNYDVFYEDNEVANHMPAGVTFKVEHSGNHVPVKLAGSIGRQHMYTCLAAIAVGISQNLNLVEIGGSLIQHETPPGRMKLIEGTRGSTIIDDTYNSSPVAQEEALESLRTIKTNGRKIAVLGDMMELGKHSNDEHKHIGKVVFETCDSLVTVGLRSAAIVDGAINSGMARVNIISFDDSIQAGMYLSSVINTGDIVLVKGSQSMRMERVVERIMLHPENKKSLLVRQDEAWEKR